MYSGKLSREKPITNRYARGFLRRKLLRSVDQCNDYVGVPFSARACAKHERVYMCMHVGRLAGKMQRYYSLQALVG